jgi:hypothetical protein
MSLPWQHPHLAHDSWGGSTALSFVHGPTFNFLKLFVGPSFVFLLSPTKLPPFWIRGHYVNLLADNKVTDIKQGTLVWW